jgi:ribosome-binding protein aMBF1 (putative translation factor)
MATVSVQERYARREDFARRLTEALAARSMAHGQLARDVGVTRACVSTWVRGISLPTGERAAAVERLVGVGAAMSKLSAKWQDLPRYQRELVVSTLVDMNRRTLDDVVRFRAMRLDELADRLESNAAAYDAALAELGARLVAPAAAGGPDA